MPQAVTTDEPDTPCRYTFSRDVSAANREVKAGFFLCFLCGLLFVFWTGAIAVMERRKEQEEAEGAEKRMPCGHFRVIRVFRGSCLGLPVIQPAAGIESTEYPVSASVLRTAYCVPAPAGLGKVLRPPSPDDDLLGEMLEGRP